MPVHGLIYRGITDTIGAFSPDALFVIINEVDGERGREMNNIGISFRQ